MSINPTPSLKTLRNRLKSLADREKAAIAHRFFKTGPGEYGEGDRFLGIRVPKLREQVKRFPDLSEKDILILLNSRWHEERLLALLMLVQHYRKAGEAERQHIYELFLANTDRINNWDLVDSSAEHIVGAHLLDRPRDPLYQLAQSRVLWERRIAMVSTFHFIRRNDFGDTLSLAEYLLQDREDLIHKVVGWMLREVGKRDRHTAEVFLRKHHKHMPRTMLRYAIERYPEDLRQDFLKGRIG